jgi:hypothetical protein
MEMCSIRTFAPRAHGQQSCPDCGSNPCAGISTGLKQKRRHHRGICIGGRRDRTEPISETDMLDCKVSLDELQLLLEREFQTPDVSNVSRRSSLNAASISSAPSGL